jgi:hypothetical protein
MSTPVPPPYPTPEQPGPTSGAAYPGPGTAYSAPGGAYPVPGAPSPAPPSATLAIAGLVTSVLGCTALVGLVLSIIALVRVRRGTASGRGLAIAGIVVGALWLVVGLVAAFGFTGLFVGIFQTCAELGDGVHQVDGVTYTCNV